MPVISRSTYTKSALYNYEDITLTKTSLQLTDEVIHPYLYVQDKKMLLLIESEGIIIEQNEEKSVTKRERIHQYYYPLKYY